MGKVVMYSTVSVDGFIAGDDDMPGPLFDWLSSGDVPLDETGQLTVSQASYDHTRAYWDQIGVTIVGRHVFDLTDGWGGTPPSGIDHVVVVSHRPAPEGWHAEAPFHFVDGVEAAMAKAQELAGDRTVEVAAGAGYFDQAHFGHEFQAFTGLTPTRYIEVRRQFLREHPGHTLDGWPLPAD